MQRRDFYLLVAETGVNQLTLKRYLDGSVRTHPAIAKSIEDAAAKLGIELPGRGAVRAEEPAE